MAKIAPYTFWQSFDNNGDPLSGGKIYTYEAGTTTPKVTYTDAGEGAANTNPIILDSAGRANIWLDSGAYKFIIYNSSDVLIDEVDDITGDVSNAFGETITTISTNTSINEGYNNTLIITSSSPTLSLDSAAVVGEGFAIGVRNSDSGTTTIDADGSETINGSATLTLGIDEWAQIYSDGTNWIALKNTDGIDFANLFSDLSDSSAISGTDLIVWGDVSDGDIGKQSTVSNLRNQMLVSSSVNDTLDTTNDLVPYYDDSTGSQRKTSFDNIFSYLTQVTTFESSAQTISNGGFLTIPHGLGTIPLDVKVVLKCTTTDLGWLVDEYVVPIAYSAGTASTGITIGYDDTNIYVQFGSNGVAIHRRNSTIGVVSTITNSSWELYAIALVNE